MRTSTVLCFFILVLCCGTIDAQTERQYTLTDFENQLNSSKNRFVQNARSNPEMAFNVSTQTDLFQTLTIAAQLFNRRLITAQKASDDIMREVTNGLMAVLDVPVIRTKTQNVCNTLRFPFTDAINNEEQFFRFRKRINKRILKMCTDLSLSSSHAITVDHAFTTHLENAAQEFVDLAPVNFRSGLCHFWRDLTLSLDFAATVFNEGILGAKDASEEILRHQIVPMLNQTLTSPNVRSWAQERLCSAREFPFPERIENEEEYYRFRIRLNRKLDFFVCSPLGLTFGSA